MSRFLISKKGRMPMVLMILGLVCIVACIGMFASGATEHHYGDSDFDDFSKAAAPIMLAMAGLLCVVSAYSYGKTSVSVYDDHIEGVGVGKAALAPHSFYFAKNLNYTVQQSKGQLKISCGSETYTVSLTPADAQAVYRCVYSGGASWSNPNPAPRPAPTPKPNPAPRPTPTPKHEPAPAPKPNPAPAPAPESKIASCPHCGAKCRVPAGKGLIRIACPNPVCKIPFTFES